MGLVELGGESFGFAEPGVGVRVRERSLKPASTASRADEVDPVRRTGWLCGFGGCLGLVTVPVALGLDRAAVAEGRVEPVGVEPAFDPADQVAAGVGP